MIVVVVVVADVVVVETVVVVAVTVVVVVAVEVVTVLVVVEVMVVVVVWVVVVVVVAVVVVAVVVVVFDVVVIVVVVDVYVTVVVVVVVMVDDVVMQVPHMFRHRSRTCTPTALLSWQEATVYRVSCPHSLGSGVPLHKPVVVDVVPVVVVAVVVVAVVVVAVVEAVQESHAIGQRARRSGIAWHCADVTPLQSWAGSGVRVGSAPLQSSQLGPDQGWSQEQV